MPRSGRGSAEESGLDESDMPARGPEAGPQAEVAAPPVQESALGDPPAHPRHRKTAPTPENLEARAAALRERYGAHGLHVVVERPFVVIGDESVQQVQRRAEGTVRWAVERLERDYFGAPPRDIVEVWLFADDISYRHHALAIFDDRPDTPYGYFTPTHQALIMNIATGGGTLVHELVHPYIDADFPECPAWFNEGLASLYEQCSDREGHIWGLTNWRLAGLQQAIRAEALPTFATLLSTTRDEFYDEDPGSNYAQARYLCYWLQEQGRLPEFYRAFRRDVGHDPTGLATLRAFAGKDLRAFQGRWERWVMDLRYG